MLFSTEWKEFLEFSPIVIEQEPHPYYINTKENFNWYGSVIVKYKNLRLPQQLRNKIHNLPYIKNGGYHFSYLGGKNAIRKKLESIIEGKKFTISDSEKSADEYISKCLDDGIDLWNPKNHFYTVKDEEIEIDNLAEIRKEFPQFFK